MFTEFISLCIASYFDFMKTHVSHIQLYSLNQVSSILNMKVDYLALSIH